MHTSASGRWFARSVRPATLGQTPNPLSAIALITALTASLPAATAHAEEQVADRAADLKKLSVLELMDIEVTSVSRHPEKLATTASAVQVLTHEDIRRSAAMTLPEALRLAPNLQVAQANASQWAISARGFDNVLANKLLVQIDGREVYTPLYAGVFWDVQDVMLEDIDRIEVVSGPGGTLWGANAVNGIISVTTRNARDTQGFLVSGGGGDDPSAFGALRYGGQISNDAFFRVYAKATDFEDTLLTNGSDSGDHWNTKQGGWRIDWDRSESDKLSFQSDLYGADPNPDAATGVDASGGNVIGRWQHEISADSDLQLQAYYDRTRRDFNNGFIERLNTYDLDGQHRFRASERHEVTWGFAVRLMDHDVDNLELFAFLPAHRRLERYSVFSQDEITLAPDRLRLAIGSKFEHNNYTGFEFQPSVRLAWNPVEQQTVWGAVSRAVRIPARIDRDFNLFLAPGLPVIAGADFDSEKVLAWELGWRMQSASAFTLSSAAFFNRYDDLRSAEPGPPPFGIPITFRNGVRGDTYGVELSAAYQVAEWWRLRGGYTFLKKHLEVKPDSNDSNGASAESDDPENQVLLQSTMDLPGNVELDVIGRYVDRLPAPVVDSYLGLDVHLGWTPVENLEVMVIGRNLLDERHAEFVPTSPSAREIERGILGKIVWNLRP